MKSIFEHTNCISEEAMKKYISGKLTPAQKHEVEKHLVDCEMCSDAVEGLGLISDTKRIPGITSELNRKIQNRVEKSRLSGDPSIGGKEVKIIFLRQYRTQLAVAASIVLILGLVWFFRSNMSMKEMDAASSEKIFADKFEAPPSDLSPKEAEEGGEEKEQTMLDNGMPVTSEQPPVNGLAPIQGPKTGKDGWEGESNNTNVVENTSAMREDALAQKSEQAQTKAPAEEKADKDYRYKNAEAAAKGNSTSTSSPDMQLRDAAAAEVNDISKNRNESEFLKEKDKKSRESRDPSSGGEEAKPQSVPAMTVTGTTSGVYNQPVTDKKAALAKQDKNKAADDRERAEAKSLNRANTQQDGDVLALESKKKSGGKLKKEKEAAPQKPSGGYYETEKGKAAPVTTESQTKATQSEAPRMDSLVQFSSTITSEELTMYDIAGIDAAMDKYDRKDYAGAVNDFEETLKKNPSDEKALFYSAVSYLSLGQTEKAVTNLTKVLQNKNGEYYDSAQWYLSLAYIKNNDTKNARKNLQELQNNSKSRYQKQADETLKEMKK